MTKRQVGILWGGDKEVTRSEGRGTIGWDRDPVRDGENCPRQRRVTGNGEKGTDGGGTGEVVGKDSGTDRGVCGGQGQGCHLALVNGGSKEVLWTRRQ